MVFSREQETNIKECYFRRAVNVNGEWQYSNPESMADFQKKYPELVFS